MLNNICPYGEESSNKYLDFCLIVAGFIIFKIIFIVIFFFYIVKQNWFFIVLCIVLFVLLYFLVLVIINLDQKKLNETEQRVAQGGTFGESNEGRFRCIHGVLIYLTIVMFIILGYCIYIGIVINKLVETNSTTIILINSSAWSGGLLLLILIMCIFMSCRWCTNVGRYKGGDDYFGEDTPFLSSQSYSGTSPSAPSYTEEVF